MRGCCGRREGQLAAGTFAPLVPEEDGHFETSEGMGIGAAFGEPCQNVECTWWQEGDEDAPKSQLGPYPGPEDPGLILLQWRRAARQGAVSLIALRAEFRTESGLGAVVLGPPAVLPTGCRHGVG